jgi:hypothetical protein
MKSNSIFRSVCFALFIFLGLHAQSSFAQLHICAIGGGGATATFTPALTTTARNTTTTVDGSFDCTTDTDPTHGSATIHYETSGLNSCGLFDGLKIGDTLHISWDHASDDSTAEITGVNVVSNIGGIYLANIVAHFHEGWFSGHTFRGPITVAAPVGISACLLNLGPVTTASVTGTLVIDPPSKR